MGDRSNLSVGLASKFFQPAGALNPHPYCTYNRSLIATASYHHVRMQLDATWLFLSMIPGGIGFVLFIYGKKQQRWPHLVAGLLLMAYPYLATTVMSLTVVGVAICAALWVVLRMGW